MNHDLPIGDNGGLASRVAMQCTSQVTPFFLYPAFGQGANLRGYQDVARGRDETMYYVNVGEAF